MHLALAENAWSGEHRLRSSIHRGLSKAHSNLGTFVDTQHTPIGPGERMQVRITLRFVLADDII
jgi:hypothetical protein